MCNVKLVKFDKMGKVGSSPFFRDAYAAGYETDPQTLFLVKQVKKDIQFRLPYFFGSQVILSRSVALLSKNDRYV